MAYRLSDRTKPEDVGGWRRLGGERDLIGRDLIPTDRPCGAARSGGGRGSAAMGLEIS
jgi:hypothetical protein